MQAIAYESFTAETRSELKSGFVFFSTAPNTYTLPSDIPSSQIKQPATLPCTVAMLLNHASELELSELDNQDHWFIGEFNLDLNASHSLQFDGLLTHADVYLNDELILNARNAFQRHIVNINQFALSNNRLAICFRAIRPFLSAKQPRPRYITRLMNQRHLRFIRTPVLGYTPGFSSATKHVGPYRPIMLIQHGTVVVENKRINTQLLADGSGEIHCQLQLSSKLPINTAQLSLVLNHETVFECPLTIALTQDCTVLSASAIIAHILPYWPHTHGNPTRYSVQLRLNNQEMFVLGHFGFKAVSRMAGNFFGLDINHQSVYLRGASWTPIHPNSLIASEAEFRTRLTLLRDAGINFLRISGNMLYEQVAFYDVCDELGIMVYQEFAFSNFDYPAHDEAFVSSIKKEAIDFLNQHSHRPCLVLLGGGSEVTQQASMMGVETKDLNNPIFTEILPSLVNDYSPHLPYVISSPYSTKGLPFHTGDGPCHFFAIGGYRRNIEEARIFKGRFISECLPFSHIPEDESLRQFWGGEIVPSQHPLWKEGVTRDPGSGWDFSDITDFYTEQAFAIDTVKLRSIDNDRYLQYCRAALVHTVESTLSILRADSQESRAVSVWLLNDFKNGAGWGYIDSLGKPKSAFYALARTAQITTVLFADEGLDGLALYLAHDGPEAIQTKCVLTLITAEGHVFEQCTNNIDLSARSIQRQSVDGLFGHFIDSSYAYQFGPRAFVACVAQLYDSNQVLISQKVYASPSITHHLNGAIGFQATVKFESEGVYHLSISTEHPAYFVNIEVNGFQLSDNYFHVMPNFEHQVILRGISSHQAPIIKVRALNTSALAKIIKA